MAIELRRCPLHASRACTNTSSPVPIVTAVGIVAAAVGSSTTTSGSISSPHVHSLRPDRSATMQVRVTSAPVPDVVGMATIGCRPGNGAAHRRYGSTPEEPVLTTEACLAVSSADPPPMPIDEWINGAANHVSSVVHGVDRRFARRDEMHRDRPRPQRIHDSLDVSTGLDASIGDEYDSGPGETVERCIQSGEGVAADERARHAAEFVRGRRLHNRNNCTRNDSTD